MKIGSILTKENYTQGAIWCNKNNAHIEKQDGKYIVVANVAHEPSVDEQITEIDAQYEADKIQLFNYYTEAVMRDDAELQEEVKSELNALDAQYDLDFNTIG